jgi:hypothetical protein
MKNLGEPSIRNSPAPVTRECFGNYWASKAQSHHTKSDAFDYRALQPDVPIQIYRLGADGPELTLDRALWRNPDGTLVGMQRRLLVIATPDGEHQLAFPKGWGERQLRERAERQGLIGGRPVSAHVPPPETPDEFIEASRTIIRAVFGPCTFNVHTTRSDGELTDTQTTQVQFHLSPLYLRGIATTAFHYFLWACRHIGGDEPEFAAIRAFVRHGLGLPADCIIRRDSLVTRGPVDQDMNRDLHVFAAYSLNDSTLVGQIHFFSQPVGPAMPTFVVRLGDRPALLSPPWCRTHIAAYAGQIDGHAGTLHLARSLD